MLSYFGRCPPKFEHSLRLLPIWRCHTHLGRVNAGMRRPLPHCQGRKPGPVTHCAVSTVRAVSPLKAEKPTTLFLFLVSQFHEFKSLCGMHPVPCSCFAMSPCSHLYLCRAEQRSSRQQPPAAQPRQAPPVDHQPAPADPVAAPELGGSDGLELELSGDGSDGAAEGQAAKHKSGHARSVTCPDVQHLVLPCRCLSETSSQAATDSHRPVL